MLIESKVVSESYTDPEKFVGSRAQEFQSKITANLHDDKVTISRLSRVTGINKYSGSRYYRSSRVTDIFKFKKLNDGVEYLVSYVIENGKITMDSPIRTIEKLNFFYRLHDLKIEVPIKSLLSSKYPEIPHQNHYALIAKAVLPGLVTEDMYPHIHNYFDVCVKTINGSFSIKTLRKLNLKDITLLCFGTYSRDRMKFMKKLLLYSGDSMLYGFSNDKFLEGLSDRFIASFNINANKIYLRYVYSDSRLELPENMRGLMDDLIILMANKFTERAGYFYVSDIIKNLRVMIESDITIKDIKSVIRTSHSIRDLHDETSKTIRTIRDKSFTVPFNYGQDLEVLADSGFFLPKSPRDLRDLGDKYHNCVYSYTEDVRNQSTTIVEDPKTNSCVELNIGKDSTVIRQVLGKFNNSIDPLSFWDVVQRIESVVESPVKDIDKCWGYQPKPEKEVTK